MKAFRQCLMAFLVTGLALIVRTPAASANDGTVDVPVPATIIYAGQLIQSSMLGLRTIPVKYAATRAVFQSDEHLVGMVARTTLMPRRPIGLNQVTEPDVVSVNRPAIMHYSQGQLLITGEVQPLNSAKAGEMVRARNIHTGVIVTGIAERDGTITAGLGAMMTARGR